MTLNKQKIYFRGRNVKLFQMVVLILIISGCLVLVDQISKSVGKRNQTKTITDIENCNQIELLNNLPGVNLSRDQSLQNQDLFPRIMCLLFTTPQKYLVTARAVNDTWAQRCDEKKWFMTTNGTTVWSLPADVVAVPGPDGRQHLTEKSNFAFKYAYRYIHSKRIKVDWFLKADDDAYIIIENLRAILNVYNSNVGHYIGSNEQVILPHGYNGGGAGYVLSKEAVRLMVEDGPRYHEMCRPTGAFEDVEIGRCLSAFDIYPINTLDLDKRLTFHGDHPHKIFAGIKDARNIFTSWKFGDPYRDGKKRVMSPYTVSFHKVEPAFMYMYDFLLYDIRRNRQLIYP